MQCYITLTKGYRAAVDESSFNELNGYAWYAIVTRNRRVYAARQASRKLGKRKPVLMHRQVLEMSGVDPGKQVDHIDGDSLNNCRTNLRPSTVSQNHFNVGVRTNSKCGYKGVYLCKKRQKWSAEIMACGIRRRLRYFDTAEEAAAAYNEMARELHGEFAALNVIGKPFETRPRPSVRYDGQRA